MTPLQNTLDTQTRPGKLFKSLDDDNLLCTACGHLCKLRPGQHGVCKVRFNSDGTLLVSWHVTALHPDYKMTGRKKTPVGILLRLINMKKGRPFFRLCR